MSCDAWELGISMKFMFESDKWSVSTCTIKLLKVTSFKYTN